MSAVLSASLEDYLKAIFRIVAVKQAAHAKDISARLSVSNSSVTGALRTLADRGLINYAPYDLITLTPLGQTTARDIVRRQEALREFFTKVLAVDADTAEIGACKMEHEIPPAIFERFIQFVDFVEVCLRAGSKWIHGFDYSCRDVSQEVCAECVRSCLERPILVGLCALPLLVIRFPSWTAATPLGRRSHSRKPRRRDSPREIRACPFRNVMPITRPT